MRRGFTLMELMVAAAMAGVIATAAVGAGMQLNATMAEARKRVVVWDEAKRLEEALVGFVQEAGGDPLTPAFAITHESATAGNCPAIAGGATEAVTIPACTVDADRIRIITANPQFPVCKVTGNSSSVLRSDPIARNGDGLVNDCCFYETDDHLGNGGEISQFARQPAVFVPKNPGPTVRLALHQTTGNCGIAIPPGAGNPNTALGEGTLVVITQQVIFAEADTSAESIGVSDMKLKRWIDFAQTGDNTVNGVPQTNEVELIADHIYSFQVALGYDGAPADGDVVDNGTSSDEWLFAIPSDGRPASIRDDQLRMVGIGIVVGGKAGAHAGEAAAIFDGPPVSEPGIYLAATQSRVAIRNLNIAVP